ncbi:MAG: hypothetical protein ACXWTP_03685 [Methylosarcina sp.]
MSKMKCELYYHSESPHLQQLYTGFYLLYKKGVIDLKQQFVQVDPINTSKPQHLKDAQHAHLDVILNGTLNLHYDTHDAEEIDEDCLEKCNFYFKRSFLRKYIATLSSHQEKIYPLGLNYFLLPDEFDHFAIQRMWNIEKSIKSWLISLLNYFDTKNLIINNPRQSQLESLPNYNSSPKVLFLVTAHDPYDCPDRKEDKIFDRISINETRAKCIKLLRDELGNKFLGGFNHTEFTKKNYNRLLIHNNKITYKSNYLQTLKSYPICISTTGLHGSIGWKMAEYVSLSKAIVSERLNHEVPGNFYKGDNYLEFLTPEECVEQSVKLIKDKELRNELMRNNSFYYRSNLRPDLLVLNTLLIALNSN